MLHQIKQIFRSPKFVVGFCIFMFMLLFSWIYPAISPYGPQQMVGNIFYPPGKYVSVTDTANSSKKVTFDVDAGQANLDSVVTKDTREQMVKWLTQQAGVSGADSMETADLIACWHENYDPALSKGMTNANRRAYERLNQSLVNLASGSEILLAAEDEDGSVTIKERVDDTYYVNTSDITNTLSLPLGADNFGADVLTKLASSISSSLQMGLMAGVIATAIGLVLGLLAGYLGGWIDNLLVFVMNIFTVIPSFVILILIANSVGQSARGPLVVATIIGLTGWPWTARSVRSQVLSLRNRDHVNLSKLSGHSMPRIIIQDILPYVASYVVMALILQISSGILAEAQLSMLGLGPSNSTTSTLGIMMMWAQNFQAIQGGSWWAFIPVVLSVAIISFSLNLMNTGLDQVFNPQLRD